MTDGGAHARLADAIRGKESSVPLQQLLELVLKPQSVRSVNLHPRNPSLVEHPLFDQCRTSPRPLASCLKPCATQIEVPQAVDRVEPRVDRECVVCWIGVLEPPGLRALLALPMARRRDLLEPRV